MSEDSNLTAYLQKQHEQVSKYGIEIPAHFDLRTQNAAAEFSEAISTDPEMKVFPEISEADIPFVINTLEEWGIDSSLVASKMLKYQKEHHGFISPEKYSGDTFQSIQCREIATTAFDFVTTARYLKHSIQESSPEDQSFEIRHEFSTTTLQRISLNEIPVYSLLKQKALKLLEKSPEEDGFLEEKLAIEKAYLEILSAPIDIYAYTLGIPDYTLDKEKPTPPTPDYTKDENTGKITTSVDGRPQEQPFQLNYDKYSWIPKDDVRWIVGEKIGGGGMSEVYQGWDLKFGRYVAMKELPGDFAQIDDYQTLFEAEAKTMARLDEVGVLRNFEKMQHSGIVRPYDFIKHNGKAYIMMEYLDEKAYPTLDKQELTIAEIIEVNKQLALTIDDMDQRGFQHNDLKPGNIFVSREKLESHNDAAVKIGDFGLTSAGLKTSDGEKIIAGTPSYMSPERIKGAKTNLQSEVYSLAVVAYQMILGRLPQHHIGKTPSEILRNIVNNDYQPLKDDLERRQLLFQILKSDSLVDSADEVFQKAFSKDLNVRYQTASEFATDLNNVLSGNALQDILIKGNSETQPMGDVDITRLEPSLESEL